MKKIFCLFVVAFFSTSLVLAHPPTDLKLSYVLETQTLRIEMTHVTSHMRKHHIRRLEISKNDEAPLGITVAQQTTPSSHTQELIFPANPGDKIRVEAFSTEGGTASADIVVPSPPIPVK